jgi:hypothetical protein
MLTSEQEILMGVLVGCIPYLIKRRHIRGGHVLEVQALFWSVQYTSRQWTIHVPLIERLRHAIWTMIMHLREDDRSQE